MTDESALAAALKQVDGETVTPPPAADTNGAGAGLLCPDCGKSFKNKAALAGHKKAHTGGGGGAYRKSKAEETPAGQRATAPAGRKPPLERRLTEFSATIGLTVSVFDPVCGGTIVQGSERFAAGWAKLAQENPAVKRVLENILQTSAWGEALIGTAGIILPIMAHHRLLPPEVASILGPMPAPEPEEAAV